MRILAGVHKGRTLLSPPGGGAARPITGRAKKSLFSMLGERLAGATVVDLYCGTGTLGLEAISRGASRCFFADRDWAVLARLRRNIAALGVAEQAEIWRGDVAADLPGWLAGFDGPIHIAFVDPPYRQTQRWDWRAAADRIFSALSDRLAADGLIVLRTPRKIAPPTAGPLVVVRTRTFGDMAILLLGRAEEGE